MDAHSSLARARLPLYFVESLCVIESTQNRRAIIRLGIYTLLPTSNILLVFTARSYAVMQCPSVCHVRCIETAKLTIKLFHRLIAPSFYFSHRRHDREIPMGPNRGAK